MSSQEIKQLSDESERTKRMLHKFKIFELPGSLGAAIRTAKEFIHPIVISLYKRGDQSPRQDNTDNTTS